MALSCSDIEGFSSLKSKDKARVKSAIFNGACIGAFPEINHVFPCGDTTNQYQLFVFLRRTSASTSQYESFSSSGAGVDECSSHSLFVCVMSFFMFVLGSHFGYLLLSNLLLLSHFQAQPAEQWHTVSLISAE